MKKMKKGGHLLALGFVVACRGGGDPDVSAQCVRGTPSQRSAPHDQAKLAARAKPEKPGDEWPPPLPAVAPPLRTIPPLPMPELTPAQSTVVERAQSPDYVPSVRKENLKAIGSAATAFATYLNAMHRKIHPIFSDRFLALLDDSSAGKLILNDASENPKLSTTLEIALDASGSIAKLGVVKSSGIREFDEGVLKSVVVSAPFGAAPPEILSPDGLVYMHWEFHRDEVKACSTMYVRAILLKTAPEAPASDARSTH